MASPKGFDKEYIFSLIMPTTAEEAEEEEAPEEAAAPAAGGGEVQAELAAPEEPDSLSLLREKLNRPLVPSAVQLRPGRELVVVNLMEQLVTERLDAVFEKFNCCRCDKCRHDVAALALNVLPPQYVVAQPEEIPALLAAASTKEIPGALVKAILQVKSNPQH